MEKVYTALSYYEFENYISFDLSMLNRYNYYTGIVFSGYTYGTGAAIVTGGRYNNLLSKFGKDAPSVGFAILVDELMLAISRNKVDIKTDSSNILILYDIEQQQQAIKLAATLRLKDKKIELIRRSAKHNLDEYIEYAKKMHLLGIYFFENDEDVIAISIADNNQSKVKVSELI